jgi:two-component system C4-dicarboxylate transport sensor histidine kinase DctB
MSVARYSYLPAVLSRDKELVALLRASGDQHLIDLVNAKLEFVAAVSGSSAVYLLDARGVALAADNWKSSQTFVGTSYSYRPYFIDEYRRGKRTRLTG